MTTEQLTEIEQRHAQAVRNDFQIGYEYIVEQDVPALIAEARKVEGLEVEVQSLTCDNKSLADTAAHHCARADSAEQKLRANQLIIEGGSAASKKLRAERDDLLLWQTIARQRLDDVGAERDAALAAVECAKSGLDDRAIVELTMLRAWIKDGTGYVRDDAPDEIARAIQSRIDFLSQLPTPGATTKGPVKETCSTTINSPGGNAAPAKSDPSQDAASIREKHRSKVSKTQQEIRDSSRMTAADLSVRVTAPTGSAGQPGEAKRYGPDAWWRNCPYPDNTAFHNPAKLSRDQIGDGYRPLTVEEAKCVPAGAEGYELDRGVKWSRSSNVGTRAHSIVTYRIRTTPPPLTAEPVAAPQGGDDATVESDEHVRTIRADGMADGDFARTLERQRNEARRAVAERDAEVSRLGDKLAVREQEWNGVHTFACRELEATKVELRDTKAARDALMESPRTFSVRAEIAAAFDMLAKFDPPDPMLDARAAKHLPVLKEHLRAVAAKLRQPDAN